MAAAMMLLLLLLLLLMMMMTTKASVLPQSRMILLQQAATTRAQRSALPWLTCQTEKSERFIEKCDAKRGLTEFGGRAGVG